MLQLKNRKILSTLHISLFGRSVYTANAGIGYSKAASASPVKPSTIELTKTMHDILRMSQNETHLHHRSHTAGASEKWVVTPKLTLLYSIPVVPNYI